MVHSGLGASLPGLQVPSVPPDIIAQPNLSLSNISLSKSECSLPGWHTHQRPIREHSLYKTQAHSIALIPPSERERTCWMELLFCLKDHTFTLKNAMFPKQYYTELHKDLQNEHTQCCNKTPHFVAVTAPPVTLATFTLLQNAKR